jgi:hypothetical protein
MRLRCRPAYARQCCPRGSLCWGLCVTAQGLRESDPQNERAGKSYRPRCPTDHSFHGFHVSIPFYFRVVAHVVHHPPPVNFQTLTTSCLLPCKVGRKNSARRSAGAVAETAPASAMHPTARAPSKRCPREPGSSEDPVAQQNEWLCCTKLGKCLGLLPISGYSVSSRRPSCRFH